MVFSSKLAPALFLLSLALGQQQSPFSHVAAVDATEYLTEPKLVWQAQTDVIMDGNGVFTSPDDKISVVTQANGNLDAFDPFTGEELWTFTPPSNENLPLGCKGGAAFSTDGFSEFVTYTVIDDPNGVTSFTRVITLSVNGTLKWVSTPLEGSAAGSPVTSFDGRYVYLTHNSNTMSVGHFSVLDSLDASADEPVFPLYSEFNVTNPFTPPGIYHRPEEGFYDGGQGNTNDVVVWGHAPNLLDTRVGTGASFVFQFPIGYTSSNQATARQADQDDFSGRLFWIILGDSIKDWQAVSAPVLTNMGRSMYWSVSRSQFRSWVGQAGSNFARFNRGKTSAPTFGRGTPRYAACPNTPALSSDPSQPMIFAGTATNEFVKMNYLMDDDTALVRNTTSMIRSRAIVSPDDQFVYFSEFTGIVHQASTDDLVDSWTITDTAALDGEFSLTSDGSMLIVGDVTGNVFAYQVAQGATPEPSQATPAPSPAPETGFRPSVNGPISFSGQPTVRPTRSPIFNIMPSASENSPTLPVDSAGAKTYTSLVSLVFAASLALLM